MPSAAEKKEKREAKKQFSIAPVKAPKKNASKSATFKAPDPAGKVDLGSEAVIAKTAPSPDKPEEGIFIHTGNSPRQRATPSA